MARKSRKDTLYRVSETAINVLSTKKYRAALYGRISNENIKTVMRDTIGTQITLLQEFAATIPELEVVDVYIDDDITGTNFDRPEYERMIQDVENGRINCIIVKDLSRFAREHIGAGEYLEKVFPQLGVRFIAITDNIDTLVDDGGVIVPFKNVINERYAKDSSVKITGHFKTMQKKGLFCSWKPAYGYVSSESDKHKFVIDPEAAQVVRQIFDWFLEGVTMHQICKRLEKAGIPCPYKYALEKGYFKSQKEKESKLYWNPEQISKILRMQQYCGDMIQNMTESTFLETGLKGSYKNNDKEDWIIVENAHEAIVTREEFSLVQEMLEENAKKYKEKLEMNKDIKNPEYCLSGILKCAHCGTNINVKRRVKNGVATYSYICPKHDAFGSARCEKKDIDFDEMNQIVFLLIKRYMNNFLNIGEALKTLNCSEVASKKREELKYQIQQQEAELRRVKMIKSRLYEDLCADMIDESDYSYMSQKYQEEIKTLEGVILKLKGELDIYTTKSIAENPAEKKLRKFIKSRKLSKAMVEAFIDSIIVDNDGTMEVSLKIKDEYDSLYRKMILCEGGLKDAV